ncbi:MAG: hypothetical protein IJU28_11130, partial [Clostridia bacterium]|nr:hypothetical protein [Clostridia bacterium]
MAFNKYITRASDLVTSHEQTRAGFLRIALEKNRLGDPYVILAHGIACRICQGCTVGEYNDLIAISLAPCGATAKYGRYTRQRILCR